MSAGEPGRNVNAGAGAGTHQVYVDGRVYLAGPYKGAPTQPGDGGPGRLRAL